jgi:hypothetical protein
MYMVSVFFFFFFFFFFFLGGGGVLMNEFMHVWICCSCEPLAFEIVVHLWKDDGIELISWDVN